MVESAYVVFPQPNVVEIGAETVPDPGPGEVQCAASKSLVSIGTESFCLRGVFDEGTNWDSWVKYPFRPGYSMAATVVAVGEGVTGARVGDRVACWAQHRQYFNMSAEAVHRIPDGISDEDATWSSLAVTTQLAVRRAEHTLGDTIGVVGLGMLGQLVVQYLALSGARKIVAIDTSVDRLDAARAHGATHTLAMRVSDAHTQIAEITGGRRLDVAYDVTGHPAVLAPTTQLVRELGKVVLLGDCPSPSQQAVGPGVVGDSIAILGVHTSLAPPLATPFNPWTRRAITELFFEYLSNDRMSVTDLTTHRYSPEEAEDVYQGLERDRSSEIGVIFDWSRLAIGDTQ